MARLIRFALLLATALPIAAAFADETEATGSPPAESIERGTLVYDAVAVRELFRESRKRLEERRAREPGFIRVEDEVVELSPFRVEADRVREERALREKLAPDYERALERLARLDPEAANEIRVTRRTNDAFYNGERDPRPMGVSAPEYIDWKNVESAIAKIRKFFGGREPE